MTEIEYRKMLEAYGFEVVFMSMLPQSAWDRYYMQMRRKMLDAKNVFTKEFKDSMMREIDVYYNFGGMYSVGYLYGVVRLAKKKQVKPAPERYAHTADVRLNKSLCTHYGSLCLTSHCVSLKSLSIG